MSQSPLPQPGPSQINVASASFAAIGLYIGAILLLDVMALLVRVMSSEYSVQELSAYRNVLGMIPSLVVMAWTGELSLRRGALRITRWRLALFRGVVVALAQLLFYAAIAVLELATVATLAQTNALFVVLLSVMFLGERVGVFRIAALIIGFAGVVLILRPGTESFTAAALLPVGAALCYAFAMVTVRSFGSEVSNGLLYLYSSFASALSAIVFALFTTSFTPIASLWDASLILIMSISGGAGVLLLMMSFRLASPSVLAPFGYIAILSAGVWGWLFFGEAPFETLFPGALLIIGAGAMIIWREMKARSTKS